MSVFRVAEDANTKVAEIPVGKEPWCVAITSGKQQGHDGRKKRHDDDDDDDDDEDVKVYVTNMVSGTVSVIDAEKKRVVETIRVGTEPFGCALTPGGRRLYVANQSSGTVSVIDTRRDSVHRRWQEGLRDPAPLRAARARGQSSADPERGGRQRPGRTCHCNRRADQ
ncbi:MAG: hypothetical protein DMD82_16740 [Candidatus Rokuibacteriota bacterium]|nr:MAG: hypothetical protein DMD82_16740 [Candidatus Rokubacteria bacterium]